ncbi:MAG: 3-isopropylmalate dehydrogenase [Parvularculales bacterium]
MSARLLVLPGDGIGPEVMAETCRVLSWFMVRRGFECTLTEDLVGGACYEAHGVAVTDATVAEAKQSDAVLFGAVGGPKWDNAPFDVRPEAGLLRLRKDLDLFANLRPALCFAPLADASSLKRDIVEGLDILIVRELTGGVYFGEPRGIEEIGEGVRRGVNTQIYDTTEIHRVARVAFDLARRREGRVTSVEKRNVMESGLLWHEEVVALHEAEYGDVTLDHMLADNCAMQLVRRPKQFDVIVTDNLFGDILSDIAAMLTGSLGMLPSASLGIAGGGALYEPVHGSAPDITGSNQANPLAMILSLAMALRYSFDRGDDADLLERAVVCVLDEGWRTADIMQEGMMKASTTDMGDAVLRALDNMVPLA